MTDKSVLRVSSQTFGDTTAEDDQQMLKEAFVATPDFRTLIESDERTVVVGRRGTGKSALYFELQRHWSNEKKLTVLTFSPEDTEVIGFRSLLKPFSTSFNLARASTRLLWRYALLMEVAEHFSTNYKLAHLIEGDALLKEHLGRWQSSGGGLLTKCRTIAKAFLSSVSPEEAIGDLPSNLDLSRLEESVLTLVNRSDRRFVILMDRLDEGYEPDSIGIGIVTGLVYASIELNKRTDKIRPIIFLRDNIFRAIAKEDPDYSRNIEGQIIRLHWDWTQLLLVAAARMRVSFFLDFENDQKIWDRCTAGEMQGRDGFKRCLQFTLYRPRDLLSLLNEAFFCASRAGRRTAVISDLEFAAKSISVTRLEDLWKEYQKVFPSIRLVTNIFANGEPELSASVATAQLTQKLSQVVDTTGQEEATDIRLLEPSGILQGLYSVGFFGVYDATTSAFNFCHDGRTPDKGFSERERLLIHPCYWLGLNLSRNALMPDEAAEITDEYGIQVQSVTPEIRKTKIGQIIAQLDRIPLGREGEAEFEHWCLDALRIVFASHLTNIELHPNHNAVQRRDIVGRNRDVSEFWTRIQRDYGVRQAIFEVKNFIDLGPIEFRQLQSYLVGTYGRLGFILTRDQDENLRAGKELDWVKEMYYNQQVLVVKINAKFICKLLQKLRSPEKHDAVDRQMGALLDVYERNYLSLKSTTRTKK